MEKRKLEPGLLAVFRLFTGLRVAFAVVFTIARLASPEQDVRLIDLFEPVLLMVILWLPGWRHGYEHILLPVALAGAGIGPLMSQADALAHVTMLRLSIETIIGLQTWASMIVLLLPVVLIAWQYHFQQVALYSVGITLLNVFIIGLVVGFDALESLLVTSSIMFRLITFMMTGWLVIRLMIGQRVQRYALKEANRRVLHHAATLEQLTTTRERNRLARELHDTLAHTLSAVAVQLEAVDALWNTKPDQALARLQKSIEVTRSGLTETRRVLQDLRASPLDDLGLALAVRNLAESTASRGGLKLDVHISDRLDGVPPDIEQAVYRIAQEALENVLTHANARHLTIQLGRFNVRLILTVSDDGQGFDHTADQSSRFGIKGMRERAEMIGGVLELESHLGQGTIVMFSIEDGGT